MGYAQTALYRIPSREIGHTLRNRLLLGNLLVLGLLGAALLWNGYRLITDAMGETIQAAIVQTGQILNLAVFPYTSSNDLDTLQVYLSEFLDQDAQHRGLLYVAVMDEAGNPLLTVGEPCERFLQIEEPTDWKTALEKGVVHVRQPVLLWDNSVGSIQYGLSTVLLRQAMEESIRQGALIIGISIAITAALGFSIGLGITRRIGALIETTAAIAEGDYDRRAPEEGKDELARLAQHINHMVAVICTRQEALEASERSLRATVENTPHVAIQWYDVQGRVVFWNQASESLYQIPVREALGKTLDQLIFTQRQTAEFLERLDEIRRTGIPKGPYDARIHRATGETGVIQYTIFGITRPDGQPLFVCMSVDITDQRRTEAELEQRVQERTEALSLANRDLVEALKRLKQTQKSLIRSEKLASLGSLVAGVAHELNTPLGTALTVATTLQDRTREFLGEIQGGGLRRSTFNRYIELLQSSTDLLHRNLHRAADLITSFKHVAVDQASSQRRRFSLRQTVTEVVDTLHHRLKRTPYRLTVEIPEDIFLDSYPGPLGQVLTNLLDNALIHGLAGRDQGHIRIQGAMMDSERVSLHFCDDGVGIPTAHQERLFDPFFTTRLGQGGSGLGLNIVHNIVEGLLGGTIRVQSHLGEGTCFIIEIPLQAPASPQST